MTFRSKHNNNDEDVYKLLYDTYRNRVFAIIGSKVQNRNDILDIMQNVFFHLWVYKASITSDNAESIVLKTCRQEISKFFSQQNKQSFTRDISEVQIVDESVALLETIQEKEEQLELLQFNIELLPSLRKQVFKMNKIDGISHDRIAEHLKISKKAVKKQIYKAVAFLKNQQKQS